MIAPRLLFSGERTRPRVLSLAPRQRLSLVEEERDFGEAPKWAREGACAPQISAAPFRLENRPVTGRPEPVLPLPHRSLRVSLPEQNRCRRVERRRRVADGNSGEKAPLQILHDRGK